MIKAELILEIISIVLSLLCELIINFKIMDGKDNSEIKAQYRDANYTVFIFIEGMQFLNCCFT